MQSLGEQTVDLLARLVRLGCVNDLTADSGGEERAADLLEEFFAGLPVSIERVTPHPGRTTLVVTVEGSAPHGDGTPLTLVGHTDVVPVDEAKWTRDPFGAQIEDGVMWGRGTVDMLHLTAAMAVITREVARRAQAGEPPARSPTRKREEDWASRGSAKTGRKPSRGTQPCPKWEEHTFAGVGEATASSWSSAKRVPPSAACTSAAMRATARCRWAARAPSSGSPR